MTTFLLPVLKKNLLTSRNIRLCSLLVLFTPFIFLSSANFFIFLFPLCSDTDWGRNRALVQSNLPVAMYLLGRELTKINRWLYLHPLLIIFHPVLLCSTVCTGINRLIIFPQWLHWCVFSPKGQHILLIDVSHATVQKREGVTHGDKF